MAGQKKTTQALTEALFLNLYGQSIHLECSKTNSNV